MHATDVGVRACWVGPAWVWAACGCGGLWSVIVVGWVNPTPTTNSAALSLPLRVNECPSEMLL